MKKFLCLFAFTVCMMFNVASAKVFEITGDTLYAPLVVWNDVLEETTRPRQVATLPRFTKITIKMTVGTWHQISWYSKTEKRYKTAWVSNYALAVSIPNTDGIENSEVLKARVDELVQESARLIAVYDESMDSAKGFLKQGNYTFATIKLTNALSAIFSLGKTSEMKEYVASAYMGRGFAQAYKENHASAIKDFDEVIYYDKNTHYPVYYVKGVSWEKLGFYSKAKQCFLIELERQKKIGNEKMIINLKSEIKRLNELINKARN